MWVLWLVDELDDDVSVGVVSSCDVLVSFDFVSLFGVVVVV